MHANTGLIKNISSKLIQNNPLYYPKKNNNKIKIQKIKNKEKTK
jgi:hypothetical protein